MPTTASGNKVFTTVKGFTGVNEFGSPESLKDSELTVLENATLDRSGGDVCARYGFNVYNPFDANGTEYAIMGLTIPAQVINLIGNTVSHLYKGKIGLNIPMQTLSATGYNPVIDSYSETNFNYLDEVGLYDISARGMGFTGNGQTLQACKFYLNKVNSPTGNIQAELYAHIGTFSTSGIPTGSALATSSVIDCTTLVSNPSIALVYFVFPTLYTLIAGTHYVLVIHKVSGFDNSSNWVGVGANHISHSGNVGNESEYHSSWIADGTWALCFYALNAQYGTASSALTIPAQTINLLGNYTTPVKTYIGTSAFTIPAQTLSASGTFSAVTYHGSLALTIPMETVSASGSFV